MAATATAPNANNIPLSRRFRTSPDLVLGAAITVAAWGAYGALPDGHLARFVVVVPFLLVVPGYLLLEASLAPRAPVPSRWTHAGLALGVTPALVGLVGLLLAMIPGAFQAGMLVAAVCSISLLLSMVAFFRREAPKPAPTIASARAATRPT